LKRTSGFRFNATYFNKCFNFAGNALIYLRDGGSLESGPGSTLARNGTSESAHQIAPRALTSKNARGGELATCSVKLALGGSQLNCEMQMDFPAFKGPPLQPVVSQLLNYLRELSAKDAHLHAHTVSKLPWPHIRIAPRD
jgi:hypothetical protein